MAFVRGIFIVAVLLVTTATAFTQERKHHGHNHGHDHGHDHDHTVVEPENPDDILVPAEISEGNVIDLELNSIEGSGDEEITVDRKMHRQRRESSHIHDHENEHGLGDPEPIPEELRRESEDEVEDEKSVADLNNQENTEDEEGNAGEVTQEEEDEVLASLRQVHFVNTCDIDTPLFSCSDCNSRILCKFPYVNRVLLCNNPMKPYCNNGFCSAVPSALCAPASSPRV